MEAGGRGRKGKGKKPDIRCGGKPLTKPPFTEHNNIITYLTHVQQLTNGVREKIRGREEEEGRCMHPSCVRTPI
jgi:hypothetical protein